MNFANKPMLTLMAVVLPLLGLFFWWSWRRRKKLMSEFVQSKLLSELTIGLSERRRLIRKVLLGLACALLLLALARPQFGYDWEEVRQRGRDIIVAIDTSRSMLAQDVAPNRLQRAKLATLDLLALAKQDRMALIAFAGSAFLQTPLTLDDEAFRQCLKILDVDIIPEGGSSLRSAIQTALTAFSREELNHKVLVILSDGEDHEQDAVEAAKEAAAKGLKIFTVGVATPAGELIQLIDQNGNKSFLKDDQGNVVKSRLNENLLREVAAAGGGFYLPLRGATTMQVLYEKGLAQLPTTDSTSRLVKQYKERFQWPLGCAILLLIMEVFFREAKKAAKQSRRSPQPASLARAAALLIFLLYAIDSQAASKRSAQGKYEEGRYKDAYQEYQSLLEKKPHDPELHYNAGASAYQGRLYEEAAQNFQAALIAPDVELQQKAYYNLGNAQYRVGENSPDLQEKMQHWQQAVKNYESAIKLNPKDEEAAFNLSFVRKKLEELKKQQQEQKKDDKNQDDKKDPNKQEEQNQDQQKKEDSESKEEKPQSKQDQHNQQQQQQQDQSGSDQEQQKEKEKDSAQKQEENKQKEQEERKQQDASDAAKEKQAGEQKDAQNPEAGNQPSGEQQNGRAMSLQQAQQVLDAQRNEERAMIFLPGNKEEKSRQRGSRKNW